MPQQVQVPQWLLHLEFPGATLSRLLPPACHPQSTATLPALELR